MARVLMFIGIGCCLAALVMGMVSLDVDAMGRSEVNPLGALTLAVTAIACFRGHELIDAHQRRELEGRRAAPTSAGR